MVATVGTVACIATASLLLMAPSTTALSSMRTYYEPSRTWGANGRKHTLRYNVTTFDDSHFYDLDEDLDDIESVGCNNDGTYVKLVFHTEPAALKYLGAFRGEPTFLTGGGKKWNCRMHPPSKNITGQLVRRVVQVTMDGQALDVRTAFARYDEMYQEADISYASNGLCTSEDPTLDKEVCIGFNTNCQDGATQPLPLYQNQFLSIVCSDCYLGYEAEVFVELKIEDWTLKELGAGYRNMTMSGALVLTATAQATWSTGIDKVLELAQNLQLINFHIGPIPFEMSLDIPVHVTATIMFDATATATFGAESIWNIGSHYTSWDPKNHWQHVKPDPQLIWSTKIRNASANFMAQATFAVAPSIAMHIDTIFTYRTTMTPTLTATVQGDTVSKRVCANVSYDLDVVADTELDIAIPIANINDDWIWSKTLYDSGQQPIAGACTSP